MKALFDIGNSAIKYCFAKNNEIEDPKRVDIKTIGNVNDFENTFRHVFEIADVVVASIGVKRFIEYFELLKDNYGFKLHIVSGANNSGAKIKYGTPLTLGADRIANTLAVSNLLLQPAIVVDCGTAINIDVIDKDGTFIGGMITAGIETSNKALQHFAPALPDIELEVPEKFLGTDTLSCIQSGIMYGTIAMIESCVTKLQDMYAITNVIITGGHAELLHPNLSIKSDIDPYLTLRGLSFAVVSI